MNELFQQIQSSYKMRFYGKQKSRFREFALQKFEELGYQNVVVDKHKNVIAGNVDRAKYVVTAHYDTPPLSFYLTPITRIFGHLIGANVSVLLWYGLLGFLIYCCTEFLHFPYLAIIPAFFVIGMYFFPNPSNANDNTSGVISVLAVAERMRGEKNIDDYAFVLFNNEEWGLLGSQAFSSDYKKRNGKRAEFEVYNLDCVGLGSKILVVGSKKQPAFQKALKQSRATGYPTSTIVASMLTAASDNLSFKNSVMLTGIKPSLVRLFYLPRVHMPNDNRFDPEFAERVVDIVITATQEIAQEPVQEVAQEPAQEVAQEPAQEIAPEPVQEE